MHMDIHRNCLLMHTQKAETVSKMEADLERLKRDRGEGEAVKLVESGGGAKGVAVTGQPIEIKLGGGEESGDDSDDLPAEEGEEDQGVCVHVYKYVMCHMICHVNLEFFI